MSVVTLETGSNNDPTRKIFIAKEAHCYLEQWSNIPPLPNFDVGTVHFGKSCSPGPNPDSAIRLVEIESSFTTPENLFPLLYGPISKCTTSTEQLG
ncbi:hypothetical protein TNCV_1945541 [Trichonephila clavipes]|nr:hypothetical protein TNCV_1945541 [Trichonephila clavipes]